MLGSGPAPVLPKASDEWFTPGRFAALLAVLIAAVYPEVLTGQATFFHRDFAVFGYPLAFYHRESFWRGEIPFWNPFNDCGLPFLAQWNTLTLYPLSLIYLLLPLSWSLGLFSLVHLFLAGMGVYFLSNRWVQNRFAAAAAGLTFPFGALMLNCLMWPNNIAAMGWLPWVVLSTERAWQQGRRWMLAAAAVGTMQMLSGAPEVILLTWVLLVGLLASQMIGVRADGWRMAVRFGAVGAWVAALAAAQLLPFLDLLTHSQRNTRFADTIWSMPAWGWANLIVPLYRAYHTSLGTYAQPDQYWIHSYYPGVGVVALALLALGNVRRRSVWLLSGITGLCLVIALGNHGLLYSALRKVLPLLGFMRYPIKFVTLPSVLLPVLAAMFLAYWLALPRPELARFSKRVAALGLGLVMCIAGLIWAAFRFPFYGTSAEVAAYNGVLRAVFLVLTLATLIAIPRISRQALEVPARLGLLAFLWLDLMTAGPRPNPTVLRWVYEPNLVRHELHLSPQPCIGESRTMLNAQAEASLPIVPMTNATDEVLYTRLAIYANANLLDKIPKVVGMYSLFPRETGDVLGTLWNAPEPPVGLADFLAVSHMNVPGKVTQWQRRPTHLPWVTAGSAPVFADSDATLRALPAPEFDARRTVFLPVEARGFVTASNCTPAKVNVREFSAHRVRFEVEASEPVLAVIAQSYYHNWRATVDGLPTRLLRANHAFQALEVPAGKRQVAVVYQDRPFYCGVVISLAAAGAWAVLCFREGRRRQRSP
jgi:hypothetical protein